MCGLKRHKVLPFSMTYMRTDSVYSFNLDLQMFDDLESQLSRTNPAHYISEQAKNAESYSCLQKE